MRGSPSARRATAGAALLLHCAAAARAEQNILLCEGNGAGTLNISDDCDAGKYLNSAIEDGAGACVLLCVITCCVCCICMSARCCCNVCGGSTANPDNICSGAVQKKPEKEGQPPPPLEMGEQEHRRRYWALNPLLNPIGAKVLMVIPIICCVASFAMTYTGMPLLGDGYNAAWTMLDEGLAWMQEEVNAIKGILTLPDGNYVVGINDAYFADVENAIQNATAEKDKIKDNADLDAAFALAGLILGIFPCIYALCALPGCLCNIRKTMHPLICLVMPISAVLWLFAGITLFLHYMMTDACYEVKRVRDGHFDGLLAGKFLEPVCPRDNLDSAKADLIDSKRTSMSDACAELRPRCDAATAYPAVPTTSNAQAVWICNPLDLRSSSANPMCTTDMAALAQYIRNLQMKSGVPSEYSCASRETNPTAPCSPTDCATDCTGDSRQQQREASQQVADAVDAGERAARAFDNHLNELLDCDILMRKIIGGWDEPNVTGWVKGCEDMRDGIGQIGDGMILGSIGLWALAFAAMMGHKRYVPKPAGKVDAEGGTAPSAYVAKDPSPPPESVKLPVSTDNTPATQELEQAETGEAKGEEQAEAPAES